VVRTKIIAFAAALLTGAFVASAQEAGTPKVELFSGLDFSYRDILLDRQYTFLVHLTPGIKWHITPHTLFAASVAVPVINSYGDEFSRPYFNTLNISHQMKLGKVALKPSAGLFTMDRYGLDLKAMMPLTEWLALEGQAGYTGHFSTITGWQMSPLSHGMLLVGGDIYLKQWDTQMRLIAGQFLKADRGVYAEGLRHFTHTSVGVYLQYTDFNKVNARPYSGFNTGFKVIYALPPYRRSHIAASGKTRKVLWRPADAFRLTYNMNADAHSGKVYMTDPEQNERHGWFSPDILPWGNALIKDFSEK